MRTTRKATKFEPHLGQPSTGMSKPNSHKETHPVQHCHEIQDGIVCLLPLALGLDECLESCQLLNQILVDTMVLYLLYKNHHWTLRGHSYRQIHGVLNKHAGEQLKLIERMAGRVQTLGGVAIADPRSVGKLARLTRSLRGVEEATVMLSSLLESHEMIIAIIRNAIEKTRQNGDSGTSDLLIGDVLRTHETQVWFLASTAAEAVAES